MVTLLRVLVMLPICVLLIPLALIEGVAHHLAAGVLMGGDKVVDFLMLRDE